MLKLFLKKKTDSPCEKFPQNFNSNQVGGQCAEHASVSAIKIKFSQVDGQCADHDSASPINFDELNQAPSPKEAFQYRYLKPDLEKFPSIELNNNGGKIFMDTKAVRLERRIVYLFKWKYEPQLNRTILTKNNNNNIGFSILLLSQKQLSLSTQ
jgi:hypothetical protein